MLPISLFSPHRVPVALHLLAAFSPGCLARSLHVHVRRPTGYHCKLEVGDSADGGDLKVAVIAELQLGVAPDRVRLLRERRRGAEPVALDSSRRLADQGVREGAKVLVEVRAPPALLPAASSLACAPLAFLPEEVGGMPMMVADLAPASAPAPLPFFLALEEHAALQGFLKASTPAPSLRHLSLPRMLMLTGTIKSGKTRLLHHVIPGLLAARHAAAAAAGGQRSHRQPVAFTYTFPLHRPAEECAQHLVDALLEFAREQGVQLLAPLGHPLNQFPHLAATLAARVQARGGELWLLLDELGAPIVGSEPHGAAVFTLQLKDMLQKCWAEGGSVVGTGGGMVSLLSAMFAAAPNGFALWSVVQHVQLGRQTPTRAAALAMARRLHAHHAAAWPGGREGALASALTPERCVAELARQAHGDVTDPRPALVAHLLELLGSRTATAGSAEEKWAGARQALLHKLCKESAHDAAVALERLPAEGLRLLRSLADGRVCAPLCSPSELGSAQSHSLAVAQLLCQDSASSDSSAAAGAAAAPVLCTPYGALVRSWVTREGLLAVSSAGGSQGLPLLTRSNLKALHTLEPRLSASQRSAVSEAVLGCMLDNGMGTLEGGSGSGGACRLRAPHTVEEFVAIPAIASVLAVLAAEAAQGGGKKCFSVETLKGLLRMPHSAPAQAEHAQLAGLKALMLLRHMEAQAAFPSGVIVSSGFSFQVIVSAVNAALECLLAEGSAFSLQSGVLSAGLP